MRQALFGIVAAVLLAGQMVCLSVGPAAARPLVDVELVLAVDVSLSMDHEEQLLQREGYIAAFRDARLLQAIASGPQGRIAVTYVEWAGDKIQDAIIGWTIIDTRASASEFADRLAAAPISRRRMTSISGALLYAASLFDISPVQGLRRVIDISGDGPNNSGGAVTPARDQVIARGIVINGLPIMLRPSETSFFDIANLDQYYEQCVIGGPGAFVVAVRSRAEFVPAIRRKLILEVSSLTPRLAPKRELRQAPSGVPDKQRGPLPTRVRVVPIAQKKDPSAVDCEIGERMWRQYLEGGFKSR